MQRQGSFAEAEYAGKKKQTRRDKFLAEMEQAVPWSRLVARLAPLYPKGERGRPPIGLERMLRVYFVQQWYGLADEAVEDALYDSQALRGFAGIALNRDPVPDATTVLHFRHWLERHDLTKELFDEVGAMLEERGLSMRQGTIVDATIIAAPSSTKNKQQSRDPEMHQTKKGKQWYFGMKAHVGVDSKTKLIHSAVATAANVADPAVLPELLHGEETKVWGDQAYRGQTEAIHEVAPRAQDLTSKRYRYKDGIDEVERAKNRTKSRVRSKVEHVFQIMKLKFGFVKVRYRGLGKNANRLFATCALVNLFTARWTLLRQEFA